MRKGKSADPFFRKNFWLFRLFRKNFKLFRLKWFVSSANNFKFSEE
jgi:hypothetical protein